MNENGCDIQMKQRENGKNSILCLHESSHTRQRDEITHSFLKVKKYIFFFLLPRDDSFGWTLEGNYVCRKNSLEKGRNTIASDTSRYLFAERLTKTPKTQSTTQAMRVSNVEAYLVDEKKDTHLGREEMLLCERI